MSGKRYCSHCGKEVPGGAKFCRCCGNPIQPEIVNPNADKVDSNTNDCSAVYAHKRRWISWIIICLAVCLVVIFSALFARGISIDQQTNNNIENEKIAYESGEDKKNNLFTCPDCSGTGYVSVYSANAQVCGLCGGSGMYYNPSVYYDVTLNMWMGEFMACAGCGGSGYVPGYISVECSRCGGTGKSL